MRTGVRTAGFVLVCLFLWVVGAFADSQARIVRLSYVEGEVQIDRGDGHDFIHAFLNMPVIEGSRLQTTDNGRAEIEFEDGSTVRLTPNTEIYFRQLRLRDDGHRLTSIDIERGMAYFHLRDREQFNVYAAGQEFTPVKSANFRLEVSAPNNELRVAVLKGQLEVFRSTGERVNVRKNETLIFDLTDTSRYFLSKGVTEEAFDYWDRERDQRHSVEYASNQGYSSYSPNYVYGVPDLYQYGSFFNVAGYGYLWRPYFVSIGWNPYSVGYWVWYPGFGYVWVSPYPWGWTPFRYGSWVFVGGHGWCWRPVHTWHNWNAFTPVVNPPLHRQVFNHPPPTRTAEVIPVGNPTPTFAHTGDIPGRRPVTDGDLRPGRRNGDGISIVGPTDGSATAGSGFNRRPDRTSPTAPGQGTATPAISIGGSAGADAGLNRGGRPTRDADAGSSAFGHRADDGPTRPDVTVIRGRGPSDPQPGTPDRIEGNVIVNRPSRMESTPPPIETQRVSPPPQRQQPPPSFSRPERIDTPRSAPPQPRETPSFSRPAPSAPPPSPPPAASPRPASGGNSSPRGSRIPN